jgi:hypothetical protein
LSVDTSCCGKTNCSVTISLSRLAEPDMAV